MELLILVILFIYALVATVFDLKKRIIPNALNYGMWLVVIALGFYFNQITNVLLFGVTSFVLAYVLFKLGVWAGGDAKLYVALCAALPLLGKFDLLLLLYVFIVSALVVIPVIGFLNARKVAKHIKEVKLDKEMLVTCTKSASVSAGITTAISIVLAINPLVAGILFVITFLLKPPLVVAAALLAIGLYLHFLITIQILVLAFFASILLITTLKFFVVVQKYVLREEKKVKDLKEGDLPANSIYVHNGKVTQKSTLDLIRSAITKQDVSLMTPKGAVLYDSTYSGGVSEKQIVSLKSVKDLQVITIRKTVAFAPALALAYFIIVLLL